MLAVAVLAGCGGQSNVSAYWRLLSVASNGKTLQIQWTGGVGDKLDRIDAAQTPRSVRITVYVNVFRKPRIAILAVYRAAVHLHEPLGNRQLEHGSVNYTH